MCLLGECVTALTTGCCNTYYREDLNKRTMKAKAFAIAGALSVVSIALPQSAKAQAKDSYDYMLPYTTGSFATLCGLHKVELISTTVLQAFQKSYMSADDENFRANKDAIDDVLEMDSFKDCPLRR